MVTLSYDHDWPSCLTLVSPTLRQRHFSADGLDHLYFQPVTSSTLSSDAESSLFLYTYIVIS